MSNNCENCGFTFELPPPNVHSPVMLYGEQKVSSEAESPERWTVNVDVEPDYDFDTVSREVESYLTQRGAAANSEVQVFFRVRFPWLKKAAS